MSRETLQAAVEFAWSGSYSRGAMKERRALKRTEAEARNARTPAERRKSARR